MFYGEFPLGLGIYDLGPYDYLNVIAKENQNWQSALTGLLSFIKPTEHYALVLVGSDGRLERHQKRVTDIVAIAETADQYPNWALDEYLTDFGFCLEQHDTSVYDLTNSRPLSIVQGVGQPKSFPDFLLYSHPIGGNWQYWYEARERVLTELQDPAIRKEIRGRNRKEYAKAARTGSYSGATAFDISQNIQYYHVNGEPRPQQGFKMPFLRLAQSWLDLITIDYLRAFDFDKSEIEALARYMPTPATDRINFFGQSGWLNDNWQDIFGAYGWFLREYHFAQERFYKYGETETPFNPEEFEFYSRVLLDKCVYHS